MYFVLNIFKDDEESIGKYLDLDFLLCSNPVKDTVQCPYQTPGRFSEIKVAFNFTFHMEQGREKDICFPKTIQTRDRMKI